MEQMKFVILGGIGYIGGRLSHHLRQHGHYVCITTRSLPVKMPAWISADEVVQNDLYDIPSLTALFSGKDVIINLAGPDEMETNEDPLSALKAGGEIMWQVLSGIAQCPVAPAFIYLSTFHVYGKDLTGEVRENRVPVPVHPYALGKYFGEGVVQLFRHRHLQKVLCVRLSNAFGFPEDISVTRWTLVFNDLCMQAAR